MDKYLFIEKTELRKDIAQLKSKYTSSQLVDKSKVIISSLESLAVFQRAKHIFVYNSMPDEVYTKDFIDRWRNSKQFYLPIIEDGQMHIRKLNDDTVFRISKFGIEEPLGNNISEFQLELVVVPGVAFDMQLNRLGRGKGYYDCFLKQRNIFKVAIGFDFQVVDVVPVHNNDIKMDCLITESVIYPLNSDNFH